MRVSTIDVGSNTVRLLVADVVGATSWQVVEQHQTVTRLGEGLATAGTLGESPMARTVAVVSEYVARAERLAAERVRVVATSAVREAANGRAFVTAVERATGRPSKSSAGKRRRGSCSGACGPASGGSPAASSRSTSGAARP